MRKQARCRCCQEKWPQFKGLCRTCSQELGLDLRNTREREADKLAREALSMQRVPPPARAGVRTVAVGQEEFLVVWDGSTRLPIHEALERAE